MSTSLCGDQKLAKSSPQLGRQSTCFAVAIRKGTLTIGHIPAEISKVCWFFLRHGGTIKCRVSIDRRCHSPLEEDGLKVPCELIFIADDLNLLKKLKEICTH